MYITVLFYAIYNRRLYYIFSTETTTKKFLNTKLCQLIAHHFFFILYPIFPLRIAFMFSYSKWCINTRFIKLCTSYAIIVQLSTKKKKKREIYRRKILEQKETFFASHLFSMRIVAIKRRNNETKNISLLYKNGEVCCQTEKERNRTAFQWSIYFFPHFFLSFSFLF